MSLILKNLEASVGPFRLGPLSFELERGEYLGVVGPSGSGKTTLLRTIAGLQNPDSGEIRLGGSILHDAKTSLPPEKRNVGMLFQNLALWPHLNVAEHLSFVLRYRSVIGAEAESRIDEQLDLVRLGDKRTRKPHELSGGESQRLALARAVIGKPDILLLDEPFAQLDPHLKGEVVEVVRKLHRDWKIPVLHVTHDPAEIAGLSGRIALLRAGKLEQYGPLKDFLQAPATPFVAHFFRPMIQLSETLQAFRREAR